MREATAEDVRTYRFLSFNDLQYIVPPHERTTAAWAQSPPDAEYLPQVEWTAPGTTLRENVCIRGINVDTMEVMIDCGFGRVYWIGEGDPAPILQKIKYQAPAAERERKRAARQVRARAERRMGQ